MNREADRTLDARPGRARPAIAWIQARRWPLALWAFALGSGIVMRWWILTTSLGTADLDEATVGIQARRFLDGDLNAFFFNQPYGGTVETALVAATFAAAGSSVIALKMVPMALALTAAALSYLSARELELSRAGQWCVPVVVWCGPAYAVLFSTKERGFYGVALVLAAAYPLLVLRIARSPSRRDLLLLGTCLGVGWWQTPLTLLVALPALAWLVAVHPERAGKLWWAVPTALVGALPWLWWNAGNGWASLEQASGFGTNWWDRFFDWMLRLQVVTGLETPFDATRDLVSFRWAGLVVLAAVVAIATRRTAWEAPGLLATLVVGYGALYAVNTLAAGVGEDPRYTYLMVPVVALCIGAVVPDPSTDARRFVVGAVVLVAATATTWWGLVGVRAVSDEPQPNMFLSSPGIDEVAALLEARGVDAAITDLAGTQIAFLTDEEVVGASFGVPRVQAYEREGRAAVPSTYVLDRSLYDNARRLRAYLDANGIGYELETVGKWDVVFVDQRVLPSEAGLQVYAHQLTPDDGG